MDTINAADFVLLTPDEISTPRRRLGVMFKGYRPTLQQGDAMTYLLLEQTASNMGLLKYYHNLLRRNNIKPPSADALVDALCNMYRPAKKKDTA